MIKHSIRIALISFFLSPALCAFGQENCACCTEHHRAFDFWAGTWDVFNTAGKKVGENEITVIESGCAIMEKWTGLRGGTGTSLNYFDAQDSTWNQLWVSGSGTILKLKGSFQNGQMVLRSETFLVDSLPCYNQISWSLSGEQVKQVWGIYEASGTLKRPVFEGRYVKRK